MNTQLANSLAEAVSALSLEEFRGFQVALLGHMVKKTPGVAGGHACVRNTRIAVWTLISLARQGMNDEDLIRNFPGLTPFDLLAARVYYQAHQSEIEDLIASHHSEDGGEEEFMPHRQIVESAQVLDEMVSLSEEMGLYGR
ncbi:MAG: hypothetical protein OHK0012_21480 [Synechococcales cyanobacterium]